MRRAFFLAAIAALGLAAAIGYTAKPALAWDIAALPAPYTVDSQYNASARTGECQTFYVVHWYDQSVRLGYGAEVGQQFSDCNPQFQQQLDAFVDGTINQTPPVTTTTAAPTTTAATTTTVPAATDTTATITPSVTTTAMPATTTAAAATVTVTTTIVDPTIDQRLAALETQYAALAARVDAISQANDASWSAFINALNSGASTVDAALAARSAGMNAIYLLG